MISGVIAGEEPLPLIVHYISIAITFVFIGSEIIVVSTQVDGFFCHLTNMRNMLFHHVNMTNDIVF